MSYTTEDVYTYLDDLRNSGIVNMYGAVPYIMDNFSIDNQREATKLLSDWMETLSERHGGTK